MPDNISKLYNALLGTYELGSEDDFRKYLSDSKNREALRKELKAEYDTGDEAAFSAYLGFGQPAQKPAQAQPVVKQTTGQVNPTVNTSTQRKQDEQQNQNVPKLTLQQNLDAQMPLPVTRSVMDNFKGGLGNRTGNVRNDNGTTFITEKGIEGFGDLNKASFHGRSFDSWEKNTPNWQDYEIDVPESPHSQVNNLTDKIDYALSDAKGRAVEKSTDFIEKHPIISSLLTSGSTPEESMYNSYQFNLRSNGMQGV